MKSNKQAYTFSLKNQGVNKQNQKNSNSAEDSDQENLDLGEAYEDFSLMAKVDGRSEKTLNLYQYVYDRFTEQVPKHRSVKEIEARDIRQYLSLLMDEGLKNTTVAIHHRVLQAFFNWLVEENFIEKAPTDKISEPKTPNKFPKVLNEDQVEKLLNAAQKRRGQWSSFRNYAMLIVFVDMGLRLNELVNALLENLDMERRSLKVHGKGAKDRKVYFGKRTFLTLRRWLKLRTNLDQVWGKTIFISQNGDKLKKRNVQRLVTRIQRKAGLEDIKVSPHVLRHTAATLAVKNGLDAFSLKRQFGWEQIETALRYVHLSDKSLQESYINSSPMDNLN